LFYMFMQRTTRLATCVIALLLVLAGGSATKDPYLLSDNQTRPPCPSDLTYSCVEYLGKKMRCFCASRDELRGILEPDKH